MTRSGYYLCCLHFLLERERGVDVVQVLLLVSLQHFPHIRERHFRTRTRNRSCPVYGTALVALSSAVAVGKDGPWAKRMFCSLQGCPSRQHLHPLPRPRCSGQAPAAYPAAVAGVGWTLSPMRVLVLVLSLVLALVLEQALVLVLAVNWKTTEIEPPRPELTVCCRLCSMRHWSHLSRSLQRW